jgi:hypothetical protein
VEILRTNEEFVRLDNRTFQLRLELTNLSVTADESRVARLFMEHEAVRARLKEIRREFRFDDESRA